MEHTKEYNELVEYIEKYYGCPPYSQEEFMHIVARLTGYCSLPYEQGKSKYMYAFYEYIDILQFQIGIKD